MYNSHSQKDFFLELIYEDRLVYLNEIPKGEAVESKDLDWLSKKNQHLLDWKSRFKEAKDALPFVDANLEMTEWELEVLQNWPAVERDA